jgi:5-methylcytosine-specific restriction endonuclease McrA
MIDQEWFVEKKRKQEINNWILQFRNATNDQKEWHKIYYRYLKSAIWQEKRKDTLKRAKGKCEKCKISFIDDSNLDVHHISYDRVGGNEKPEDLQVLCYQCHIKADKKREVENEDIFLENNYINRVNGFSRTKHGENWDLILFSDRELEFIKYLYKKNIEETSGEILPKDYDYENDMDFYDFWSDVKNGEN